MSLERLCQALEEGAQEEAERIAKDLLNQKIDSKATVDRLVATMQKVGDRFARLEIFLPEMMMSGQTMASVLQILGPKISQSAGAAAALTKGKVVLGTVKGDLHEIGKNIVKLMLEATGFEVKDLGYDVDPLAFIKEAEALKADFIAPLP